MPLPAVKSVNSPFLKPPPVMESSIGYGVAQPATGGAMRSSHKSLPEIKPSGLHGLASHIQEMISLIRPACSMSEASLRGNVQIRALPGLKTKAHSWAAALPCGSLSKAKTTRSKDSKKSRLLMTALFAPCAPEGIETTGYRLS